MGVIINTVMKKICLFILTFFFTSFCHTKTSNEHMNKSRYYRDIDLFTLTGVNELSLSELAYPYVQIDSISANEKNLAFYYNENTVYSRNYKREDLGWRSMHIVSDRLEGTTSYFFDFLAESQIISLEYRGNPKQNGSLVTLRILKKGEELVYDFDADQVFVEPTSKLEAYPLNESFRTESSKHKIKDGILEIVTSYEYDDKDITGGVVKKCYLVNSLSYFWWSFIGYKLEKITC
jgi:hypothetical protein